MTAFSPAPRPLELDESHSKEFALYSGWCLLSNGQSFSRWMKRHGSKFQIMRLDEYLLPGLTSTIFFSCRSRRHTPDVQQNSVENRLRKPLLPHVAYHRFEILQDGVGPHRRTAQGEVSHLVGRRGAA